MKPERGELLSAACGLALLVLMFGFAWYGVDGIPGRSPTHGVVSTQNGWDGLPAVRWVILLTALVALGGPMLRLAQRETRPRISLGPLVFAGGILSSVLLIYRVLIDLPGSDAVPDQKLGALLALVAAVGIALGGWSSLLAIRQRLAAGPRAR